MKQNERNAGRKTKYVVPVKIVKIPEPILEQVDELAKPYERKIDRQVYNDWWFKMQEENKALGLMKKYDFKSPNDKILARIYKLEKN